MSRLFALPERPPLRFAMVGDVSGWDPITRRSELGPSEVWVAPTVSVSGMAPGAVATAIGHINNTVPGRVVTALSVQPRADGHESPA